jgi:hypothetical protein
MKTREDASKLKDLKAIFEAAARTIKSCR